MEEFVQNIVYSFNVYIFQMEKLLNIVGLLDNLSEEQKKNIQIWNAVRYERVLSEFNDSKIYNLEAVFCVQISFNENQNELKETLQNESLFYSSINEEDKQIINEFFLPSEMQSASYIQYMNQIGKTL